MKKELYDDYCKLVFGILDLQMKKIVSTSWCFDPLKEGCYSRLSGYLAEILISAYFMKKVTEEIIFMIIQSFSYLIEAVK